MSLIPPSEREALAEKVRELAEEAGIDVETLKDFIIGYVLDSED